MKVLLAEDELDMSKAIVAILKKFDYTVDVAFNGIDALECALERNYDAVILDIMMPRMDGITVLREIRKRNSALPVLMLTAKSLLEDRVAGLNYGADDYLPKPFAVPELLARLKAIVRRNNPDQNAGWTFGDIQLNAATFDLVCGDKKEHLTSKGYLMMEMLMKSNSAVISTQKLMSTVWGNETDAELNVVWVNISTLRKMLVELGSKVEIRANRGQGYSLHYVGQ